MWTVIVAQVFLAHPVMLVTDWQVYCILYQHRPTPHRLVHSSTPNLYSRSCFFTFSCFHCRFLQCCRLLREVNCKKTLTSHSYLLSSFPIYIRLCKLCGQILCFIPAGQLKKDERRQWQQCMKLGRRRRRLCYTASANSAPAVPCSSCIVEMGIEPNYPLEQTEPKSNYP